jgi:hypothetical protein
VSEPEAFAVGAILGFVVGFTFGVIALSWGT